MIVELLRKVPYLNIAIVTAAGYHHNTEKYEQRFGKLIKALAKEKKDVRTRMWIIGGEANYCFKCNSEGRLFELEDHEWKTKELM